MNKLAEGYNRLGAFLGEVKTELKKCAWPSRPELIDSTVVVIVSVILLAAFVGFSDFVLINLLKLIIR